jgi:hypothetical protein
MKRVIRIGGILVALTGAATQAQVVNFHAASQGYSHYGGYNVLYWGQGAFNDPGNNVWNGFGNYGGPGSTDFYGAGNPDSNHGAVPAGNPGQPYAWHSGTTESGPNLFKTTSPGAGNSGNATSAGLLSPITISLNYGFDNGADGGIAQGQPSWILSHAAVVNGANPVGTFTLSNVPLGVYDLYLYGANFDGTRGATFTASSGVFLGGVNQTINPNALPTGSALNFFALGQTYVEVVGVVPDGLGNISGTWGAVDNPISGLGGEGDFNGLQLVPEATPEPGTLALLGLSAAGLIFLRRRK